LGVPISWKSKAQKELRKAKLVALLDAEKGSEICAPYIAEHQSEGQFAQFWSC
jgi:hypothetical protein